MATISGLPGFRVLPVAEKRALDDATRALSVERGQMLFREGQVADSVWAVAEGGVHIIKSVPAGREIILEVVAAGELFGAVVAIEDRPYPASAVAACAGVVWRLPALLARQCCQRYPSLRGAILGHVAERLRSAHERLRSVALERVEQRLARALLTLASKIGVREDGGAVVKVTRQELADMTGTTVETAIRVTGRWQSAGVVSASRSSLRIVDEERLIALAEDGSGELCLAPTD
jgi:CRP/FNR family transcriptional regulator